MFLFGILSSPLPYMIIAAFYLFGFVTGMFHNEAVEEDVNGQIQVKNIHVDSSFHQFSASKENFHFHHYKVEKSSVDYALKPTKSQPYGSKEKLIYFVHDIKIPHSSLSDFYFCRPPPLYS